MRPAVLLLAVLAASGAQASWFGSEKPAYETWDQARLEAWLIAHNVDVPKHKATVAEYQQLVKQHWDNANQWTSEQYAAAQKAFYDIEEDVFATWSESRLRDFLISQGVIEPKGTRDQLAYAAREKYRAYTSYSSHLSTAASTAVYGDATQQASKSATSAYNEASKSAQSVYDQAAASASSVASAASGAGAAATDSVKSAASAASASAKSATDAASASAQSATDAASASATSLSGKAAKSASSAGKEASKSAASASSKASKSASSASKAAESSSSSLSKKAAATASSASAKVAEESAHIKGEL